MPVNTDIAALLAVLACPECRGSLNSQPGEMRCAECGRKFPVSERVPACIEGFGSDDQQSFLGRVHYAVLGNPRVYNFQQAHFGAKPVVSRLESELALLSDATVVDIGAGTGVVADLVPAGTRYVWVDNDTQKLRGLLSRAPDCLAVLGDAARLPLADDVADWSLMVEVSHHIPDSVLHECLVEAERITRDRFLFIDAVRGPRVRSKLMWNLDLGRFPRPENEIVAALETIFELERLDRFTGVNHDHVLCVCLPRQRSSTKALSEVV
jgi:hypothetical protein